MSSHRKNIADLYKKYRTTGGFGMYSYEDMIGEGNNPNRISVLLKQEDMIINMYNCVYDIPITNTTLEKVYLNRPRINATIRVVHKLSKYRIPREYAINKAHDPFTYFMKYNTIHGYMNRLYWNEREIMKNELVVG